MAAGNQTVGANTLPLTEMWNGTAWKVLTSPNPAPGTSGIFNGVSCAGSSYCVAVGDFRDATAHDRNLVATWDGTTWTQNSVPDGPDTNDDVPAVRRLLQRHIVQRRRLRRHPHPRPRPPWPGTA